MHEYGLAQEMINVALAHAQQNSAKRITQFSVEMSAAVSEDEVALRFHFENLTRGTIAEGAQMEIIRVPAHVRCWHCGHDFTREFEETACPQCHSALAAPVWRDEFRLVSIEID